MAEFKFKNNRCVFINLQKWLMQLFGDELYSNLQLDVEDIEFLLSLKSQYEESEKNVTEEIKLKKAHIQSRNANINELKTFLMSDDVSLGDKTWKQSDYIAGLAAKMNIEELDLTNCVLAIYNVKSEKFKNEEQRMLNCALLSSCSQQSLKIRRCNDALKSQLDALKEVVDFQYHVKVKITENIKFFNAKCTEYDSKVKLDQNGLKEIEFDEALRHSSLIEWSGVIKTLEEKLKVSKDKLKYYRSLPPNESLTKLKIEEKKKELKQLEEEFTSLLEKWENHTKH